jgi:hypothetical protein
MYVLLLLDGVHSKNQLDPVMDGVAKFFYALPDSVLPIFERRGV